MTSDGLCGRVWNMAGGRGSSNRSRIGEAEARAFLEAHLGRPVAAVEFVGEGAWSRCFGFRDGERDLVVRFGRFALDFEKDRRASELRAPGLPVPEVLEVGSAFDAWFAISSRVRGEPLEACSVAGWQRVLPSFFAALDAMRVIDLSGTTGYGAWGARGDAPHASWRDFLLAVERDTPDLRTHGWSRRLRGAPGGDAFFRAAHARLGELAEAAGAERHVVHADLINANVLVSDDHITGIFDWGCSLYGDFVYELAWLDFWTPWFEPLVELDVVARARAHHAAIGLDVPDLDARLRACGLHIGLDHLAYNAWAGREDDLAAVSERMLPLLEGS